MVVMPLAERVGGGEESLRHLILHGAGHGVEWVFVFLRPGPLVAEARAAGHATHLVQAGRYRHVLTRLRAIRQAARLARAERVDAVLGFMVSAVPFTYPVATLARVPHLWHQVSVPSPDWLDRLATLLPAKAILVNSRSTMIGQQAVWPRRPMHLVYPGIDLQAARLAAQESTAAVRRRLAVPDGTVVGMLARLQRYKGQHVLVAAMPQLLERIPDLQVVLVGGVHAIEPEFSGQLLRLARRLGVEERLHLPGFTNEPLAWLQSFDLLAHPSDPSEGFGLVVVEAMALGKPVVSSEVGGPREIIRTGIDGLLVPPSRPELLADAIATVLLDPALSARLGAGARERAEVFSDQAFAERFAATVAGIVRGDTAPIEDTRGAAIRAGSGGTRAALHGNPDRF